MNFEEESCRGHLPEESQSAWQILESWTKSARKTETTNKIAVLTNCVDTFTSRVFQHPSTRLDGAQ